MFIISTAIFKSADSSTNIWQLPVPVSMTGTVAFCTTAEMRPAPPLGISTSKYSFIFMNSVVTSRELSSIREMAFGLISKLPRALLMQATMASFELAASLPPFRITALPVLKQSPKASAVTFGLASYIIPITPIGTRF